MFYIIYLICSAHVLIWLLEIIVWRGHYIYKAIWILEIGEILRCEQERGNLEDSCAVWVIKDATIVGHVPHEKSRVECISLNTTGL